MKTKRMDLRARKTGIIAACLVILVTVSTGIAYAGTVGCAVGGGNTPAGWTLNGVGGGLAANATPFIGPSGSPTDCYIVTDTGGGFPGGNPTGFWPSGSVVQVPGTTNGSQMISNVFTATAGSKLNFDFMFATNDGTGDFSDWANVALVPTNGGTPLFLFTARTGAGDQVVPGYGFPGFPPGLVLTPGSAFLHGDQWYLDALTGSTSSSDPNATQYGPTRYQGGLGGSSDWNNAVFTFDASDAGTYQLEFTVANVGDTAYSSALFFSGQSISTIAPEPGTLILFGTSVLGLAGIFRRKLKI
ncbi:MAG: PEP-CTERM sorting domain-containing protein [Candidatus Korobacteraceae bacterium]